MDSQLGIGFAHTGTMRPPAPAHSPQRNDEVRLHSQPGSTTVSSSAKTRISLCVPDAGVEGIGFALLALKKIAETTGMAWQKPSTTSRVRSVELLSTTNASHAIGSASLEAAILSNACTSVWQRLYVHRITVIFIFYARNSMRREVF